MSNHHVVMAIKIAATQTKSACADWIRKGIVKPDLVLLKTFSSFPSDHVQLYCSPIIPIVIGTAALKALPFYPLTKMQ
ncbi:MAG: hypothetical protein RID09_02605 [Coleofasciculus sp. G1-WW12-02]|uniref:hypothetical protein n=1 Tax=Coleofasciculus sp. G1-WW12-02 TaxID=3068483 RepID=UPI0033015263